MKKLILTSITCLIVLGTLKAQKLPNVQKVGLWAPENVKIDGKTTEWGNQFKAYNHATNIYYTIANDNKNLYLLIQVTDPVVITNIAGGGITLAIQKSDKDKITVTYPVAKGLFFTLKDHRKGETPDTTAQTADSIMRSNNNKIKERCKYIAVTGIKALEDTLSIYNTAGIKTASLFNNRKAFTYEVSIPVRYLNMLTNNGRFTYHIKINGSKGMTYSSASPPGTSTEQAIIEKEIAERMSQISSINFAPTDFWGEYTLAKQ